MPFEERLFQSVRLFEISHLIQHSVSFIYDWTTDYSVKRFLHPDKVKPLIFRPENLSFLKS